MKNYDNINDKMNNENNNLINDSNLIIVNKISEIILKAIKDENYISSFSTIIYKLIPKEFIYAFTLLLKEDYINLIKSINLNKLVSIKAIHY